MLCFVILFIKSILKSLVILQSDWLSVVPRHLFTNPTIFCFKSHLFEANEIKTIEQNNQSDFKINSVFQVNKIPGKWKAKSHRVRNFVTIIAKTCN